MIVKICGIKSKENIELISKLNIGMVGLNFYPPSVRYISPYIDPEDFGTIPQSIAKVGVFVNATLEKIQEKAKAFNLDYIQLHGNEGVEFCRAVSKRYKIIKVFRVDESFDLASVSSFDFADYFLFDTATKYFGGSGKKFDWTQLTQYNGKVPYLLSGGIGPNDIESVQNIKDPNFIGIDINSKFESEPGIKDENLLIPFLDQL